MPAFDITLIDAVACGATGWLAGSGVRRLVRRGSHRRCGEDAGQPPRLRWVPGVGALAFVAIATGHDAPTAVLLAAAAVWLLTLSAIDLDVHRLPNALTLPAYPILMTLLMLMAVTVPGADLGRLRDATLGGIAMFTGYATAHVLARARGRPPGIGLGDVKLAGALGLLLGWLGWWPLLLGAYAGFVVSGVVAAALLLGRRAGPTAPLAHGPAMALGALAAVALPLL